MKPLFIAEVKTKSPFGFKSPHTWDELFEVAKSVGDWVSIHTDPRWGGSLDLVSKARKLTQKPILAKGLHCTLTEVAAAVHAGADYVLCYDWMPWPWHHQVLFEPRSLASLKERVVSFTSKDVKVVWNKRDLDSGKPKVESFDEARALYEGWMCQASMINNIRQIAPLADAVLVGEHLKNFSPVV